MASQFSIEEFRRAAAVLNKRGTVRYSHWIKYGSLVLLLSFLLGAPIGFGLYYVFGSGVGFAVKAVIPEPYSQAATKVACAFVAWLVSMSLLDWGKTARKRMEEAAAHEQALTLPTSLREETERLFELALSHSWDYPFLELTLIAKGRGGTSSHFSATAMLTDDFAVIVRPDARKGYFVPPKGFFVVDATKPIHEGYPYRLQVGLSAQVATGGEIIGKELKKLQAWLDDHRKQK